MPAIHTAGDGNGLLHRLAFKTASLAGVAGGGDDLAAPSTGGAGGYLHHGPQEGLAHLAHFAASAAVAALRRVGAGFSALAVAGGAHFIAGDLNLFFDAKDGFFKSQNRGVTQVRAAPGGILPLPAAACGKAKEFAEDIGKIHRAPIGHAACAIDAGMSELVVSPPLIGIRKHRVCFVDFLEFLLSVRFLVYIRVKFTRQGAEG